MKVLVTGGGGFLGSAICRLLKARGDDVVSLSRSHYGALSALGVRQVQGDVAALDSVLAASKGCDAVIHTAALAGIWGHFDEFSRTNIGGTMAVIGACELNGVGKLVHTSTPSVVHAGHDIEGGNESLPYASQFKAHYPATKAVARTARAGGKLAEARDRGLAPALDLGAGRSPPAAAHPGPRQGRTTTLHRPAEEDRHDLHRQRRAGASDALDRLAPSSACAGRACFISQDQPIALEEMVNRLLRACGREAVTKHLSPAIARVAARCFRNALQDPRQTRRTTARGFWSSNFRPRTGSASTPPNATSATNPRSAPSKACSDCRNGGSVKGT